MSLSDSDKTTILLNLLDRQTSQIERREQKEQQWFEWQTGLLLATFGAIVALAQRSSPLPYLVIIKSLATVLVGIPTLLVIYRIVRQKSRSVKNAETIERIQQLLHLFDEGVYGSQSPYPKEWAGNLAKGRLKRTTPNYYALILLLMMACVITTIWLVL
jgi:hypothetical protein